MLCPFCNNLTHCHFDHQVDKNIGLFAKTNVATGETLQVIPPFTFFGHCWCRFLVLWMETNKHTNMSHTGFRSNLIIFNAVQFFGFHHKITNASSTFSYTSSATNKSTSTTTKPGWGGEPTLSFETCELSWQQNIQEFSCTLDLTTRELLREGFKTRVTEFVR